MTAPPWYKSRQLAWTPAKSLEYKERGKGRYQQKTGKRQIQTKIGQKEDNKKTGERKILIKNGEKADQQKRQILPKSGTAHAAAALNS